MVTALLSLLLLLLVSGLVSLLFAVRHAEPLPAHEPLRESSHRRRIAIDVPPNRTAASLPSRPRVRGR